MDSKPIYQFNQFFLEPKSQSLFYGQDEIKLEPRIFEVLHLLLQRPNEVITKEEFFDHVWEEKVVSDWALSRAIKEVRKKLKGYQDIDWVKTLYGKGYIFTQEVKILSADEFKQLRTEQTSGSSVDLPVSDLSQKQHRSHASESSDSETSAEKKNDSSKGEPGNLAGRKNAFQIKLAVSIILILTVVAVYWGARPATSEATKVHSIVVLPINNIGSSSEHDYLANGLTDIITGRLAQNKDLRVISKTSATYYKNKNLSPKAIANELNVESILEGSFYSDQDKLNLNLRLIDAESEELLWSINQEQSIQGIYSFYQAVSQRVAERVGGEIAASTNLVQLPYQKVDQEILKFYLRATYLIKQRTSQSLIEAEQLLLKCIQRNSDFAEAYAELAGVYIQQSGYSYDRNIDRYSLAQRAVSKALELNPNSSKAWAHQGLIALGHHYDFKVAEMAYQKAIELDPGSSSAKQWYAELLAITSREEQALAVFEATWIDDPFNRLLISVWGSALMMNGDYQAALDKFELAKSLGDKMIWLERDIAYAHQWLGDLPKYFQVRLNEMKEFGYSAEQLTALEKNIEAQGVKGFWLWRLPYLLEKRKSGKLPAARLAEAYAGAEDYNNMLFWFKEALADKHEYWLHTTKRSPEFYKYRHEPEFSTLLAQYGISIEK